MTPSIRRLNHSSRVVAVVVGAVAVTLGALETDAFAQRAPTPQYQQQGYPQYPQAQQYPQLPPPQQPPAPQPSQYPQYGAPPSSPQVQQGPPQGQPPVYGSCSVNPCAQNCACAMRCCRPATCGCDTTPKVSLSVTGIRGSITRVTSNQTSITDVGASFAGGGDAYALDGSTHAAGYFVLGGGEGGFEGALAGVAEIGYRVPVSESHGPFGRAGFDGRLQGNDDYYFSMLELPRLSLGWQYIEDKIVLEAGARGGPILTGRYNPGPEGYRRLSGSFEWGGFVAAQIDFLRADVSVMRIEARKTGSGTPVDMARANLCGVAGKVGVCADFMLIRGDADMGPTGGGFQKATTAYGGITFGIAAW